MDDLQFLKPWMDPGEVFVLTSPTNRTSMSAQTFMQGVFNSSFSFKLTPEQISSAFPPFHSFKAPDVNFLESSSALMNDI